MKKKLTIIFSIIGGILLVLIGFLLYLGISISDSTDNTNYELYNNTLDTETYLDNYMYDAIDETKENEEINYELDIDELNSLLYAISKDIKIPFVNLKAITAFYEVDGNIRIEAPIQYALFKSCIRANIELKYDNGSIKVSLSDIKVGKLSINNWIIKITVLKYINPKGIEDALRNVNINSTVTLENGVITIDVNKDIIINALKSNDDKKIYGALYNVVVDNDDLIKVRFNNDNVTGVNVNLKKMKNVNGVIDNLEDNIIPHVKENTLVLIQDKNYNKDKVNAIFNFLMNGYNSLSDDEIKLITDVDFSLVGITDYKNFTGYNTRNSRTMKKIILDNSVSSPNEILEAIEARKATIDISEENLNEILTDLDFVGESFIFRKGNSINYIVINSMFADISENEITMYLIVDINGYNVEISFTFSFVESKDLSVTLNLKNMKANEVIISNDEAKLFMDYLNDKANVEFMSFDSTTGTVLLDFTTVVNYDDSILLKAIKNKISDKYITLEEDNLIINFVLR